MEGQKKYFVIGIIVLGVGIVIVMYLFKKPILAKSLRATGGGCSCEYTYVPSTNIPGTNEGTTVESGTWAYVRGLCDADTTCKGFVYDPITSSGILRHSTANQGPWPATHQGDLGAYIKKNP